MLNDINDPAWAWAAFEPTSTSPWTLAMAGHLYRRAGFGATWGQLQQALADGPQAAVDRLLKPTGDVQAFNGQYDRYEAGGSHESLRAWWLRRMLETPFPLLEKMTLFWHDHFSVRFSLAKDGGVMAQHIQRLRTDALGSYRKLLADSLHDPGVLLNMGADAMRKALPSEALARQLLERYTVGPGEFGEADVKQTARALTGWFVLRNQLRYFEREWDDGTKTVLGQTGEWDVDGVVQMLADRPQTGRLLARRLYRWFISEVDEPGEGLLEPLAKRLSEDDDLGQAVEVILRSNLFFSAAAYRRKIKSPVELALGMATGLEATISTGNLGQQLAALGQDLYEPPTAGGWAGGRSWLNDATLIGRDNLAAALTSAGGEYGGKLDPAAVAESHGRAGSEEIVGFLIDLYLQGDLPDEVHRALKKTVANATNAAESARRLAHAVTALPEFQLC